MPAVQKLYNACKASLTPTGPISDEAVEKLRALLDKIKPSDVGLQQEAQLARRWKGSMQGGNEPIQYYHIYENDSFAMGIFRMPASSIIPLHNYPGMTVLSKLLYGTLHVTAFDWIDLPEPLDPSGAKPAKLVKNCDMIAPCETTVLYPKTGGDLHFFRAVTPCAIFDILSPPYDFNAGRHCTYYKRCLKEDLPGTLEVDGVTFSEVNWLEEIALPEAISIHGVPYKGRALVVQLRGIEMVSSIIDSIHSVLDDLANLKNSHSLGTGELKYLLKGLKTFLLCARMLGADAQLRFDGSDAVTKGSIGSLLIRIGEEINSYALKIHSYCKGFDDGSSAASTLEDPDGDDTDSGMFPFYLRTHFLSFMKETVEWYASWSDSLQKSCSPTIDDVSDIFDSVLENLVDIRGSHFYVASILLDQTEAMEESIKQFGNFFRFVAMMSVMSVEHQQLDDFVTHSATVAVNAAHVTAELSFVSSFWGSKKPVEQTQSKILLLQQMIKPIDPRVSKIYTTALASLKSHFEDYFEDFEDLLLGHDSVFIMKGFIDFLSWSLWEKTLTYSCLEISRQYQLRQLWEGLRFSRTIRSGRFHDSIITLCDAGDIIFSLSEKDDELDLRLPDLLEDFEMIRELVEKPVPETVLFNLPKTGVMGILDFLSDSLMEVKSSKVDSNVQFCIRTIRENLASIRLVLNVLLECQNQQADVQALWIRARIVMSRIKFLVDRLVRGDIPNSFSTSLDSISEDIRICQAYSSKILHVSGQEIQVKKVTWTSTHVPPQSIAPATGKVVGLENEIRSIIDDLTRGRRGLQAISIGGMPGLGKTTLAMKVYTDPNISYHFHVRIWCSVSQGHDLRKLLLVLLNTINGQFHDGYQKRSEDDLGLELLRSLKGRRYIIVFDDVSDIVTLDSLRPYLPDDYVGSRILLTSRVIHAGPQYLRVKPHFLRLLTINESWELIQKLIFREKYCPPELNDLGKRIAVGCKGLPLAVAIVAGPLSTLEPEVWNEVLESLSSRLISCTEECINTLELSYIHLPKYLKPCFLYFGLFPEDEEVSCNQLILLWIAEGFIRETKLKSLEDAATENLMDLVSRSLVIASKKGSTGEVKACRVHDLVHEFCRTKAKEENFFQLLKGYDEIVAFDEPLYLPRLCIHSRRKDFKNLRLFRPNIHSILFFADNEPGHNGLNDISFITLVFKYLRVLNIRQLDLGYVFPIGMEHLVHLRYLAVKGRFDVIPSSIGNLSNLETFVVDSTKIVALPDTIWDLHKLRHLQILPGFHCSMESLDKFSGLDELKSCSTAIISSWDSSEKLLRKFSNIHKLKCGAIQDGNGKNSSKITIPGFLVQLESLHVSPGKGVVGVLPKLRIQFEFSFLPNLRKFTLQSFPLTRSEISELGKLPNLEVLKLLNVAFYGGIFDLVEGEFPKLRFLKLTDSNIVRWTSSDDDQLRCLEKLVLEGCRHLEEIPSCLNWILTLKTIEVWHCSRSVEFLVRQIQEEQLDLGNDLLEVFIRS